MNRNPVNEVWRAHMYLFVLRASQPLNLSTLTSALNRVVSRLRLPLKTANQPLKKANRT